MRSNTGSTKNSPRITKRGIQLSLGVLWLLDGALQLQPQMFTANFANHVIAPAAQGQPGVVAGPIAFGAHVILLQPALFDSVFALTQLVIGGLILWKRTAAWGLLASVVWALSVWYVGEGLSGLLSGNASLIMGAPGAALLYAILALAVLPVRKSVKPHDDQKPAYWLPLVWAIIWVGGAIYQLLPGQNTTRELSTMISGMASGSPSWLGTIDVRIGRSLHGQGWWVIAVFALVQMLVGILVLLPGRVRMAAISAGVVLSLVFWVVGQNLGEYYSGLATDPSTAPLLILLGVAVLGCMQLRLKRLWHDATHDLERFVT